MTVLWQGDGSTYRALGRPLPRKLVEVAGDLDHVAVLAADPEPVVQVGVYWELGLALDRGEPLLARPPLLQGCPESALVTAKP